MPSVLFVDPLPYLLIASKQDLVDRSVTPLAALYHARILCEAKLVYQSSFLGNEDEEEMVRGFRRQDLDIMITLVATICIFQLRSEDGSHPEWNDVG